MPSMPVKSKRKLLVFEENIVNSNQKIQHKKVIQNLLFLTGKLATLQQSTAYGLLWSSTQWSKRMAKKEVVLVEFWIFSVEKWLHKKYKNQQSNVPSGPQKGLKLQETKEKHTFTCDKWMKKERKEIGERNGFCKKMWGSTYPSSWWFFWTLASGCFLSDVCVPEFICSTNACILCILLLSGAPFYWVDPPFIGSVPFFELWCTIIHEKRHFLL